MAPMRRGRARPPPTRSPRVNHKCVRPARSRNSSMLTALSSGNSTRLWRGRALPACARGRQGVGVREGGGRGGGAQLRELAFGPTARGAERRNHSTHGSLACRRRLEKRAPHGRRERVIVRRPEDQDLGAARLRAGEARCDDGHCKRYSGHSRILGVQACIRSMLYIRHSFVCQHRRRQCAVICRLSE